MKKQFFVKLLIGFITVILLLPAASNTWAETTSDVLSSQTQARVVLPNDLQWRENPYIASVVYTPAGVPHFMLAQDSETVVQETGFGPTGLRFITNTQ